MMAKTYHTNNYANYQPWLSRGIKVVDAESHMTKVYKIFSQRKKFTFLKNGSPFWKFIEGENV